MTTHLSFQNVFFIEMQQITLCLACFQGVVVVTGGGGARLFPMTGEVNEICLTLLHSFFRSFESDSELSSGNVISFWFNFWSFTVCFVV